MTENYENIEENSSKSINLPGISKDLVQFKRNIIEKHKFQLSLQKYTEFDFKIFPIAGGEQLAKYILDRNGNKIPKTDYNPHKSSNESSKKIDYKRQDWQSYKKLKDTNEILKLFGDNDNIAVLTGKDSKNLIVLDIFDENAFYEIFKDNELIQRILNSTYTVTKPFNKGKYVFIRGVKSINSSKNGASKVGCAIRSKGKYVLLPTSYLIENGKTDFFIDSNKSLSDILTLNRKELDELILQINPLSGKRSRVNDDSEDKTKSTVGGIPNLKFIKNALKNTTDLPDNFFEILAGNRLMENGYAFSHSAAAEKDILRYTVSKNWTDEKIVSLFKEHAHYKLHYRKSKNPDEELLERIKLARIWLETKDLDFNTKINSYIEKIPHFFGLYAATDYSVTCAIIIIARECHSVDKIGASIRRVAEVAGLDKKTVYPSLQRLKKLNLIEVETVATEKDATEYNLVYEHYGLHSKNKGIKLNNMERESFMKNLSEDFFSHGGGGVGKRGLIIYAIIENAIKPISIVEIENKTGFTKRTIKNRLKPLIDYDVVIEENGLYSKGINFDKIEEIVKGLKCYRTGAERKLKHEEERRIWLEKKINQDLNNDNEDIVE